MRRFIAVVLLLTTIVPPVTAAPRAHRTARVSAINDNNTVAFPWIAKFFVDQVVGWLAGRALDAGWNRLQLALVGEQAANHLSDLSARRGFSASESASFREAEAMFRSVTGTLTRTDIADSEARERILQLERNLMGRLAQMSHRLGQLEQRIYTLEIEQRRQLRMLVQLNGQVLALGDRLYDLEGRYILLTQEVENLGNRVGDVEDRTDRIEGIVNPDRSRFLRYGTYLTLQGVYVDAREMAGDANIGLGLSVQANLNKWVGVFGETAIIPIEATDGVAPDGSPLEWVTFPVMLGFAVNVLPPQSPVSIQLSGGGGLAYSSLRYYPEDYDPDLGNWADVGDVASLIGTAKIEIGAAPVLSDFEPVLTIGYLGFQNPINYSNGTTGSNAGRELLYLSLGGRLRTNLPGDRNRAPK